MWEHLRAAWGTWLAAGQMEGTFQPALKAHFAEATGNIGPPKLGQNALNLPNTPTSPVTVMAVKSAVLETSSDCITHLPAASAACFCLLRVRCSFGLLCVRSCQATESHPRYDSCTADSGQQEGFLGLPKIPCHFFGWNALFSSPRFVQNIHSGLYQVGTSVSPLQA